MEVEDRWKWERDQSIREIKVAAANCKKSVQSCIELM